MSNKFSLYQTDGLWGIIENTSNEKQTSIKSYFGSDLIIKRLNEQAEQIDQLKQENETLFLQLSKQEIDEHKPVYCTLAGNDCKYLGKIKQLKQQLDEKDIRIEELEGQFAYECECNMQLVDLQKQLEEKQNTIDEINKEFVQAVHDWKTLCAEKDKEIERLKEFIGCKGCVDVIKKSNEDQTQLAIQELEKVSHLLVEKMETPTDKLNCFYYINQQIKELKGE